MPSQEHKHTDHNYINRHYTEKRNFIRMQVDTPATVTLSTSGGQREICNGICHDLSGGGMLLTLDKQLAVDTEVFVSITTNHGHQPTINARCSVSRVQLGPKKTYLHGLSITEIVNP